MSFAWAADFSYIRMQQGFIYLAGVLDVFSRRLVGWSMSDRMTTPLVLSALEVGAAAGPCSAMS